MFELDAMQQLQHILTRCLVPIVLFYVPLICTCRLLALVCRHGCSLPAMAEMNVPDALKKVLQSALVCNGLARGLREVTRVLDKKTGRFLCLLVSVRAVKRRANIGCVVCVVSCILIIL